MAAPFAKTGIGATAVQLIGTSVPLAYGILIRALSSNSGTVYVGVADDVTTATGFPLAAGDTIYLPKYLVADADDVWLIGSGAGQAVRAFPDVMHFSSSGSVSSVTVDSEMPAAAALADNTANPTTTSVGTFGHVWDGSAWDRAPGNSADGLLVNLGANNDVNVIAGQAGVAGGTGADGANVLRVSLATDVPLPVGTNNIGDVDVVSLPASIQGPGIPVVDSYTNAALSASANTNNQQVIAAPGPDKQIWVYSLVGTADTADGSISLQDEDDTAITGVMEVTRRGGFCSPPSGNFSMPWFKVATNKALEIDTVTCGFKGLISYAIVSI